MFPYVKKILNHPARLFVRLNRHYLIVPSPDAANTLPDLCRLFNPVAQVRVEATLQPNNSVQIDGFLIYLFMPATLPMLLRLKICQ